MLIKRGDTVFDGCKALEDFNSGAGGPNGKARYKGREVHVKLPDQPKCPIGKAAKSASAKRRIDTWNTYVDIWRRRLNVLNGCPVTDYLLVPQFVHIKRDGRVKLAAFVAPYESGLQPASRDAALNDSEKRQFIVTAIHQLRVLHEAGLIHSDIKPANLGLVRMRGTVSARYLDFDASYFTDAIPEVDAYGGDQYYFAPEVVDYHTTHDPRVIGFPVDVFSLGLVLAELTAGAPLPGLDGKALRYPADVVRAGRTNVSDWLTRSGADGELANLLARMLHADPAQRITMAEADDIMAGRHRVRVPTLSTETTKTPAPSGTAFGTPTMQGLTTPAKTAPVSSGFSMKSPVTKPPTPPATTNASTAFAMKGMTTTPAKDRPESAAKVSRVPLSAEDNSSGFSMKGLKK